MEMMSVAKLHGLCICVYIWHEEMQMYGDFDEQLLEIYRFGKMFGFKEVDEATKAADENTTPAG